VALQARWGVHAGTKCEMESVPSKVAKTYSPRGPLQQFRFTEVTAFTCFRCSQVKKSKPITVYRADWSKRLCNGCYGRLLALYEIKAGADTDDQRAEQLRRSFFRRSLLMKSARLSADIDRQKSVQSISVRNRFALLLRLNISQDNFRQSLSLSGLQPSLVSARPLKWK
jgi:hypothetical protein